MRVIAVIDDPRVVEKILRHPGAWHDPHACLPQPRRRPAGLSPPPGAGPYTCEITKTCSRIESPARHPHRPKPLMCHRTHVASLLQHPAAVLSASSYQWKRPRKGARDAKRERVSPMRLPGRLLSPVRLSAYFLISNFGAPKLISRPCSTRDERMWPCL